MSVTLHDSRFFGGAEQTDKFRQYQKKFVFLTARKRNKRYIKISAAAEKIFMIQQVKFKRTGNKIYEEKSIC